MVSVKDEPYQPTSSRDLNSAVISGIAVATIARSYGLLLVNLGDICVETASVTHQSNQDDA